VAIVDGSTQKGDKMKKKNEAFLTESSRSRAEEQHQKTRATGWKVISETKNRCFQPKSSGRLR
jgi:hypothetical protein